MITENAVTSVAVPEVEAVSYTHLVIKYNAKEPEAAARYAKIAKFINLPGNTDEELVDALIARIREMNKDLDIPTCIKYYEGGIIDEK